MPALGYPIFEKEPLLPLKTNKAKMVKTNQKPMIPTSVKASNDKGKHKKYS